MCAIVDANVRDEVFGSAESAPGKLFLNWLTKSNGGKLALGGILRRELAGLENFRKIYEQLRLNARVVDVDDSLVDVATASLKARQICRSNDAHVLALAQVSGARLLYTNDQDLQQDFDNQQIVNNPRGAVYTTLSISDRPYAAQRDAGVVTEVHRELLARTDLCARPAAP